MEIFTALATPAGVTHSGVPRVAALALAAPAWNAPSVSTMAALHARALVVQATQPTAESSQ